MLTYTQSPFQKIVCICTSFAQLIEPSNINLVRCWSRLVYIYFVYMCKKTPHVCGPGRIESDSLQELAGLHNSVFCLLQIHLSLPGDWKYFTFFPNHIRSIYVCIEIKANFRKFILLAPVLCEFGDLYFVYCPFLGVCWQWDDVYEKCMRLELGESRRQQHAGKNCEFVTSTHWFIVHII